MKKIYLSIAALAVAVGAVAQTTQAPAQSLHKATQAPGETPYALKRAAATHAPLQKTAASGPFRYQIEPIGDIMTQKGLDLTSANPNQDLFITGLNQDSTAFFSSSTSTRAMSDMFLGSILDPKSTYLRDDFQPIVSAADPYSIDSVYIYSSYIKKTATVDTLYIWFTWGDTTATSPAFSKITTGTAWVAPISGWRKNIMCPKVQGATGAAGNKVSAAAPATNRYLMKYTLKPADSVTTAGRIRLIPIKLDAAVNVPANNIVSCFYTFVPGAINANGAVGYNLGGPQPQTINGFCGVIWGQNNPALTQLSDYADHQVDATSWNMGASYDKRARHAMGSAAYNNRINGDLTQAPIIIYSVYGTSTVGMKELENKGFSLGQNVPNPFNGQSTVTYNIDKEASSAVFTVTDVMGRVISTEKADASKGTHTITLGNYSAGVYYYSLNVDGNVTTKKMIAQ